MESITPPHTPHRAAKSADQDVLSQLRVLRESAASLEAEIHAILYAINDAERRLQHHHEDAYWAAYDITREKWEDMKLWFRDAVLYGPEGQINGVRPRSGADLPTHDDTPPTVLSMQGPERYGAATMRQHTLSLMGNDIEAAWRTWDLGRIDTLMNRHWPSGVPASILHDPGHVKHDWDVMRGASVGLSEFAYDASGGPVVVFQKSVEKSAMRQSWGPLSEELPHHENSAEHGRICGRSWRVCPEQPVLSIPLCAWVFHEVVAGHYTGPRSMAKCGTVFLKRYAGVMKEMPWTRWCCVSEDKAHLQFHVRYLAIASPGCAPSTTDVAEGLSLCRTHLPVPVLGHATAISEERVSIAVDTSLQSPDAYYTMVLLADSTALLHPDVTCHELRVRLCGKLRGVAVFQSMLYHALVEANKTWTATIDCSLQVIPGGAFVTHDLLHAQQREATLQLYKQWIEATTADLHSLVRDANSCSFSHDPAAEIIRDNWKILTAYQDGVATQLLNRIHAVL